jgi:hypothetical protein
MYVSVGIGVPKSKFKLVKKMRRHSQPPLLHQKPTAKFYQKKIKNLLNKIDFQKSKLKFQKIKTNSSTFTFAKLNLQSEKTTNLAKFQKSKFAKQNQIFKFHTNNL